MHYQELHNIFLYLNLEDKVSLEVGIMIVFVLLFSYSSTCCCFFGMGEDNNSIAVCIFYIQRMTVAKISKVKVKL